jgi:cytochrome P450
VAFWILAHTIFRPELAGIIREETAPAFRNDGSIDTEFLVKKCPKLDSIWLETLRLSASSTAVRYINQDTKVGENVLPKGHALMYSARQLHLDNSTFGQHHNEFDPWRFMNRPSLQRDLSYRPFGGGETLCPGRHLAKHVVLTFVALSLRRYDFSLAFPQSFPRYEERKPSIGVISGCDDLYFTVEKRDLGCTG